VLTSVNYNQQTATRESYTYSIIWLVIAFFFFYFFKKNRFNEEGAKYYIQRIQEINRDRLSFLASERQKIIRSLGSNWKIKSRKLVYKPNFLPSAIQEAKNSLPPDFPRLEPQEGSHKNKKLTSREASLVWRREWDSHPRFLAERRFSRPFHSTALASLRKRLTSYAKIFLLAILIIF